MSLQTILNGNTLIAEFMGLKQVNWYSTLTNRSTLLWVNKSFNEDFTHVEDYSDESLFDWENSLPQSKDLFYNSSWDWLMPVVEQIESLNFTTRILDVGMVINGELVIERFGDTKLEGVWLTCVEFIKWYNRCRKEK